MAYIPQTSLKDIDEDIYILRRNLHSTAPIGGIYVQYVAHLAALAELRKTYIDDKFISAKIETLT